MVCDRSQNKYYITMYLLKFVVIMFGVDVLSKSPLNKYVK